MAAKVNSKLQQLLTSGMTRPFLNIENCRQDFDETEEHVTASIDITGRYFEQMGLPSVQQACQDLKDHQKIRS